MHIQHSIVFPSTETLFGEDACLYYAVRNATRAESCAPLLLITIQELSNTQGFGLRRVRKVVQRLRDHNMSLRDDHISAHDVIEGRFGCIEDAPISVLQLLPVYEKGFLVTSLHPLDSVRLLEACTGLTLVRDILSKSTSDLVAFFEGETLSTRDSSQKLATEIRLRLKAWDLDLSRH